MKEELFDNNFDSDFVKNIMRNAAISILSVSGFILFVIFLGLMVSYLF